MIDRWNKMAKKAIYINGTLEIGVGRLAYSAILFGTSIIWGLLMGATPLQLMPSIMFWLRSFKTPEKEEKKD